MAFRFALLPLCLSLSACAQGVNGGADGGGRGDGSRGDTGRDAGGGSDTGEPCIEDSHPNMCALATNLGSFAVGAAEMTVVGNLPAVSDQDWFRVQFPPESMPMMPGGGMPSVSLDGDSTMILDIRPSCGTGSVSCGEGSSMNMTSYSFVDDQSMPGETMYSTRDVPWPAELWIRVARSGGPVSCADYTLTISR